MTCKGLGKGSKEDRETKKQKNVKTTRLKTKATKKATKKLLISNSNTNTKKKADKNDNKEVKMTRSVKNYTIKSLMPMLTSQRKTQ